MISIVGIGPGVEGFMTIEAQRLIKEAQILIGGKRHLDAFMDFEGEKLAITNNLKELLEYINENEDKNIVVLASGDPMLYGIGKYLCEKLGKERLNIVSGISSLQYIFSRIKVDMNDLYITSSHGKTPDFDFILNLNKVALVTDQKIGPKEIANEILKRNLKKTIVIGENLSYEDERISVLKPIEVEDSSKYDMNVVVILDER